MAKKLLEIMRNKIRFKHYRIIYLLVKEIYTISCEFFDQLNVAMQRKVPLTVVYLKQKKRSNVL